MGKDSLKGLKVVTAKEMARIESLAYKMGAKEKEFMLNAGKKIGQIVEKFSLSHGIDRYITLLVGKGNNGGDAYVAGIYLLQKGFVVKAIQVFPSPKCSELCRHFAKKFKEEGGYIQQLKSSKNIRFEKKGIILDGLLGTGFKGELRSLLLKVIKKANVSNLPIVAIDIPSGVDGNTGEVLTEAIQAQKTVGLGLPKLGFFLKDGWNHVGKLLMADFGLAQKYIVKAKEFAHLINEENISVILPPIKRTRHKYQAGYVLGIGGSKGMGGALKLSGLAALRSGAGIVRLLYPKELSKEMETAPLELVRDVWNLRNWKKVKTEVNRAKAVFVGPGIGRSLDAQKFLNKLMPELNIPCVLDADALFFLSKKRSFKLPSQTILTPHRKEMLRLLKQKKEDADELEFLTKCQKFCEKHEITLVLKGAPTFIFEKGEKPLIIPRGDPGMATAGTGDVLTGIITAFLAQGCRSYRAATLGVYLHDLAGEAASKDKTSYCPIASDLIEYLPEAFKLILGMRDRENNNLDTK